jgi:hypothetical protein
LECGFVDKVRLLRCLKRLGMSAQSEGSFCLFVSRETHQTSGKEGGESGLICGQDEPNLLIHSKYEDSKRLINWGAKKTCEYAASYSSE